MKMLSNVYGRAILFNNNDMPTYCVCEGGEDFKPARNLHILMFMQGCTSDWIEELGGTRYEDVEEEEFPFPNLKEKLEIRKDISRIFMAIENIICYTDEYEEDKEYRKIVEDIIVKNEKNIEEIINKVKSLMKFITNEELQKYKYEFLQDETPKLNEIFQLLKDRIQHER